MSKIEPIIPKTKKGFQKGHEKTGGRRKGKPNKRSHEAYLMLQDKKFDPLEKLIGVFYLALSQYEESVKRADVLRKKRLKLLKQNADMLDYDDETELIEEINIEAIPIDPNAVRYLEIAEKAVKDIAPYRYAKLSNLTIGGDNDSNPAKSVTDLFKSLSEKYNK